VLSYSHSTLQAMANSPAKRHQEMQVPTVIHTNQQISILFAIPLFSAQHIKTTLNLAGVDENALKEKCTDAASRFDRSAAFYSQKEETGAIVEFANVCLIPGPAFGILSTISAFRFSPARAPLSRPTPSCPSLR